MSAPILNPNQSYRIIMGESDLIYIGGSPNMTHGGQYQLINMIDSGVCIFPRSGCTFVFNDLGTLSEYLIDLFLTQDQFRQQQIDKII